MQKKIFITVALCLSICTVKAQEIPDSLAQDFRNFLAKNFSMYRTVNLNWETKWAHNYTFTQDGKRKKTRPAQDQFFYHDPCTEIEESIVVCQCAIQKLSVRCD